ncbi:MAG: hypothetical protein MJ180_02110 [Candidatus Gastranaerophilales bacterium]|nr:hypothetical protein [Candidatus Gastranaerophilales bacterium]
MEKIIPREVKEEPKDIKYECFRAIKTFLIILIVFCIAAFVKKQYFNMLENSRFVKFYPANTLFYID